jgi:hypothetical protein
MRRSIIGLALASLTALGLALTASTADAQSVMKQCGEQWQAAKQEGTTNGETWRQFLAQCRARIEGAGTPTGSASSGFAPASAPAASSGQSVMKQCGEEWQSAKAAGTTNGATWPQFLKDCRVRLSSETSGPAPGFAPAAPAPAQPQTGSLFPWQQPTAPAPAPAPAPASYGNAVATGAGQFASEQEARYRCPSDTVVWVNEKSHIYHFAGTSNYGHTRRGAYMCEQDAKAVGARAAMNERHP